MSGRGHPAAAGEPVYEVPASLTQRFRRHARRPGKSDAIDARAIAEVVLREGDALGRRRGDGARDELRLLYDHRDRLVRDRSQTVDRLRHAAMRLGLTGLAREPARRSAIAALRRQLEAPPRGYPPAASRSKRGFPRSGANVGSMRSHAGER